MARVDKIQDDYNRQQAAKLFQKNPPAIYWDDGSKQKTAYFGIGARVKNGEEIYCEIVGVQKLPDKGTGLSQCNAVLHFCSTSDLSEANFFITDGSSTINSTYIILSESKAAMERLRCSNQFSASFLLFNIVCFCHVIFNTLKAMVKVFGPSNFSQRKDVNCDVAIFLECLSEELRKSPEVTTHIQNYEMDKLCTMPAGVHTRWTYYIESVTWCLEGNGKRLLAIIEGLQKFSKPNNKNKRKIEGMTEFLLDIEKTNEADCVKKYW